MSAPAAADFRAAANVIRTGGLTKGSFARGEAHCTVGALIETRMRTEGLTRDARHVRQHVQLLADLLGHGLIGECPCGCDNPAALTLVTRWNDRHDTTADDVVTLLEQAAEKLEAEA